MIRMKKIVLGLVKPFFKVCSVSPVSNWALELKC